MEDLESKIKTAFVERIHGLPSPIKLDVHLEKSPPEQQPMRKYLNKYHCTFTIGAQVTVDGRNKDAALIFADLAKDVLYGNIRQDAMRALKLLAVEGVTPDSPAVSLISSIVDDCS